MTTILLLFGSNVFMTFAWYGHLKYGHDWPLWRAILVSWGIALIEYCMAVPANRLGFGAFSGFQLKIIQEAITLTVFLVFAVVYLKEKMAWNYALAFALLIQQRWWSRSHLSPSPSRCRSRNNGREQIDHKNDQRSCDAVQDDGSSGTQRNRGYEQ